MMNDNEHNALADLAVRLGSDALSLGADKYPEIEKAARIVAELAKEHPDSYACDCFARLIDKCRAIAAEGE